VTQNPKFGPGFSDFEFRISNFIMTPMSSDGSVTYLIAELKAGKPEALEKLYRSYFPRLLGLARKKLSKSPPMVEDEEDVVQSVFRGFCELADRGLYPSLQNRNDLWLLLFTLTARKVGRLRRKDRGNEPANVDDESLGLEHLLGHEPTPEEAAAFAEEVKLRMDELHDDVLRQVAQWKMESFTDEEIAQKLGCVTRTVERKLCVIRNTWEKMKS
jgi:RNA polymerase sigma factor (sigma-70 family)